MRYVEYLKSRGYKPYMVTRKVSVYNKEGLLNRGTIVITKKKDRSVSATIKITQKVKDNGMNHSNFNRDYLQVEADTIRRNLESYFSRK